MHYLCFKDKCFLKLPLPREAIIWPSLREICLRCIKGGDDITSLVFCCLSIEKFIRNWCSQNKNRHTRSPNISLSLLDDGVHVDLTAGKKNLEVGKLSSPSLTKRACKDLVSTLLSLVLAMFCLDEFKSRTRGLKQSPFKDWRKPPLILQTYAASTTACLRL